MPAAVTAPSAPAPWSALIFTSVGNPVTSTAEAPAAPMAVIISGMKRRTGTSARSAIARRVAGETAANSSQLTVPITVIHSHAPSPHPNHQARAAGTTRVTMSRMIRAAYCPHSFAPDSTPDTAACMAYMARPPAMSSTART